MKRGMHSLIVLACIGTLFLSSITFVSAETGFEAIVSWFSGIFGGADLSGATDLFSNQTLNTQILLFLLVTLIIYAVAEKIPFLGSKGWIAFGVSLIIGALATLYLKSEEINTILLSYGALGIGLTVVVPFVVAAVISKKAYDDGHVIASKLVWLAVALAYIVKIGNADLSEIGRTGQVFSWTFLGGAIAMALWEQRVYIFLFRHQVKTARATSEAEALAEVTAQLVTLRDEIIKAPTGTEAPLIQKFNRLVKRQNDFGGDWKPWGHP